MCRSATSTRPARRCPSSSPAAHKARRFAGEHPVPVGAPVIVLTPEGNRTNISYSYDPDLNERVKALGGRWDPAGRVWYITGPDSEARALAAEFASCREFTAIRSSIDSNTRLPFAGYGDFVGVPHPGDTVQHKEDGSWWTVTQQDTKWRRDYNDESYEDITIIARPATAAESEAVQAERALRAQERAEHESAKGLVEAAERGGQGRELRGYTGDVGGATGSETITYEGQGGSGYRKCATIEPRGRRGRMVIFQAIDSDNYAIEQWVKSFPWSTELEAAVRLLNRNRGKF